MTLSNTAGCRQDRFVALQLAYHSLVPNPLIAYGGTGHDCNRLCSAHLQPSLAGQPLATPVCGERLARETTCNQHQSTITCCACRYGCMLNSTTLYRSTALLSYLIQLSVVSRRTLLSLTAYTRHLRTAFSVILSSQVVNF